MASSPASEASGHAPGASASAAETGGREGVQLTLSDEQVAQVLWVASGVATDVGSVFRVGDLKRLGEAAQPLLDDRTLSRSALRAVLVLAALPADGSECPMSEIADTLGFGVSTTYRYLSTWLALGLIEQHPRSRRYRRRTQASGKASGSMAEVDAHAS